MRLRSISSTLTMSSAAESNELAVEAAILGALKDGGAIADSEPFAGANGFEHTAVVGMMKSLEAAGYVKSTPISKEFLVLSDEALSYVEKGSPEAQLVMAMPAEPIDEAGLESLFSKEFLAFAKGKAMKNKWISREKGANGKYTKQVATIEKDELVEQLKAARDGTLEDKKVIKDLSGRSLVAQAKKTTYKIEQGASYAPIRKRLPADITKEMLESGEWATATFKDYNLESAGKEVGGGHLHALMRVRAEFRSILLEMG